ncbi:restriction endonuclease subunit S [Segatella copri]|uniref:restriction endonuclease subunit S n=1 Tax=Segatella copri TaxID=165179 RepID=UPI002FF281FF
MERYSEYKDSGIQWLGEIPSHWSLRKMKYVFNERSEKNHPNEQPLCATQSKGVIPQSLYEGRVVVVNKGFDGLKFVREGDFVISLRSFQGGIEYAYYQGIISAAYTILQPKEPQMAVYFKYLFKCHDFIQLLQTCVTGIREGQNINYPLLSKKSLPLPTLTEQQAIVSYLDIKCSKLDMLVENKEKEILLLSEMKQRVIADAVTRGLNPSVKLKATNITWLPEIPEHWEEKRLSSKFVGDVDVNKGFVYKHAFKFNYGELVPKNETGDSEEYRDTYIKYSFIKKGDILINGLNLNYDFVSQRVACAPNDGIITSAYLVCRPRKGVFYNYYTYLFKAMDGMKLFHGMGSGIRLTLSFKELKKQMLPVPPLSEQQTIVSYITERTAKIDSLIEKLNKEIECIKEYKQRLISDVVTGQIKVS